MGGYFAGWVAIRRPRVHALVLGFCCLLAMIGLTITYWINEPFWYHVFSLAFILPAAATGGWLYGRQQAVA